MMRRQFFLLSVGIFVVGIVLCLGFLIYSVTHTTSIVFHGETEKKPSLSKTLTDLAATPDTSILKGFSEGRINVLLLGIAGKNSIKKGELLTDTIMIASIDTINRRVALMSLPRDLLVETSIGLNKINAFYSIGIAQDKKTIRIREAVTEVTGLPLHYSLVMDFDGFTQIVDALGGVNVTVPRTIDDPLYPGPGYSYEPFYIEKGFYKMDGETALKYVRTRHDDPESDFGRAKRQQVVLSAIRNKALSLEMLTHPLRLLELMDVLSEHIDTTISTREIRAFGKLAQDVDIQNITTVVVDAWKPDSLLRSVNKRTPVGTIAGLIPRRGDWNEINEYADAIFGLEQITLRRDAVVAENPRVILLNATGEKAIPQRITEILRTLGVRNVDIARVPFEHESSLSHITDYTDGSKPFTMDALVKTITTQNSKTLPPQAEWARESIDQYRAKRNTTNKQDSASQVGQELTDPSLDLVILLGKDLLPTYGYEAAQKAAVEKEYRPLPPK